MGDDVDPNDGAMTDVTDPKVAISMADLSRIRQNDLPLSTQERRGPSFKPDGHNGTDHYPAAKKEGLKSKWNVSIDDEESRQVEGLLLGDARPWAAKSVMALIEQRSSANSRRPRTVTSRNGPNGNSSASVPTARPEGLTHFRPVDPG
ncbi:hypothetical protein FZEAL_5752 [Fusarium zealandicum]|uniref:Uncharacterized protein n=1 Tax=Fusarium zealandicum TaxID=1053134 RepID=A0A8H4XKA2_9HYPO|nr:hypothetical protein FZEAL_5752 [Fusarium zealandicum]